MAASTIRSKKTAAKKPAKSFEETLWDTANKLRGSVESSDGSGATETTRQGCPEGERGGVHQFYTPKCVVNLIAEMTERRQTPDAQTEESAKLDEVIRKNLEGLGYAN